MTLLRAQVNFPNDFGLERDISMNVWHFLEITGSTATNIANATTLLEDFYVAIQSGLSSNMSGTAFIKWYDLTDPKPRLPIDETTFTFAPDSSAPFPNEVAIVLSFKNDGESGVNIRRRRGRLYLGPLNVSISDDDLGDTFVDSDYRSTIANAASAIKTYGESSSPQWVVFSPTTAGAEPWDITDLTNASFTVESGHIDNAFDTQRRRGLDANARSTWD